MPMRDWIDRYPRVKALLQDPAEALDYTPDAASEAPGPVDPFVWHTLPPGACALVIDTLLRRYEAALFQAMLVPAHLLGSPGAPEDHAAREDTLAWSLTTSRGADLDRIGAERGVSRFPS